MKNWLQTYQGHFYYYQQIDSTQTFIKNHPPTSKPVICLANQQTAGYGQREAKWESPEGQIYLSIAYSLNLPLANIQGLCQAIALALCQYLDQNTHQINLKWPNDLYVGEKKLAGILCETSPFNKETRVYLGIGINHKRPNQTPTQFAYYSDLFQNQSISLTKLLSLIFEELENWQQTPYLPIDNQWEKYDKFFQKKVLLQNHENPVTLFGIDQNGRLIVNDDDKLQFLTNTRIIKCTS